MYQIFKVGDDFLTPLDGVIYFDMSKTLIGIQTFVYNSNKKFYKSISNVKLEVDNIWQHVDGIPAPINLFAIINVQYLSISYRQVK